MWKKHEKWKTDQCVMALKRGVNPSRNHTRTDNGIFHISKGEKMRREVARKSEETFIGVFMHSGL